MKINREKIKEWTNQMHKLLSIYRYIGLTEKEVLEFIGKQLGYEVINQKGKPITFIWNPAYLRKMKK